jgi:hypothetical protein
MKAFFAGALYALGAIGTYLVTLHFLHLHICGPL